MYSMVDGKVVPYKVSLSSINQYNKPATTETFSYAPIAPPSFNYKPSAQLQQQLAGLQRFNAPLMPKFNFPTQYQTRQATPLNQYAKGLLV